MKKRQRQMGWHLTPEQRALWVGLKDSRLDGRKFNIRRRSDKQAVDFFCPSENLIIEIDDHAHSIEVRTTKGSANATSHCILQFPINRIRVDIGLVLAQIRGHFSRTLVSC